MRCSSASCLSSAGGWRALNASTKLGFLGPDEFSDLDVYSYGVAAAALTHGHADGYAPAGAMALAVQRLIYDVQVSWIEVVEACLRAVASMHPAANGTRQLLTEVGEALQHASEGDARRASASFGQGWVGDDALEPLLEIYAEWLRANESIPE